MKGHGFRFGQRERLTVEEARPVGYVQDDVAWAREHGYGSRIREKTDRARREDPNLRYRAQLAASRRAAFDTAFDTALDGGRDAKLLSVDVPGGGTIRKRVGGCLAEAQTKLYGELRTWSRADAVAANLRPLYVSDLLKDRRFTEAVAAWEHCMRQSGHAYADPGWTSSNPPSPQTRSSRNGAQSRSRTSTDGGSQRGSPSFDASADRRQEARYSPGMRASC
ncbi:hypothetical protein QNO09_15660 [Streptomyces sp. 378]|uniref:hypothetical protein n=1 Tax=Streptomyces sp. 378 TaxID=3049412 RepID=UPI0024C2E066|nr:hypothetical protein [Streptomyces sp. 378]MDK1344718.1 hypothetical protein [Streptomyces sp. 378]